MRAHLREWRGWILAAAFILVCAFGIRVAWVAHTPNYLSPAQTKGYDSRGYDLLARRIASHAGYARARYKQQPSTYRAPGYPYFLAPLYLVAGKLGVEPHLTFARYVQAFIGTLTVALIGLLALRLWGRLAALASMAIAAVYVPLILVGSALLTEVTFVPLFLAAILCALERRRGGGVAWAVAAGVLIGAAALTRDQGLLMAPLVALLARRPGTSWRGLAVPALSLALAVIVVIPWTIRNYRATGGEFIPISSEAGPTLAGTYNDTAKKMDWFWRPLSLNENAEYQAIYRRRNDMSQGAYDRQMRTAVFHYIRAHPLSVPQVIFWNTVRLLDLGATTTRRFTAFTGTGAGPRQADIAALAFWLVGLLALLGSVGAIRRSSVRLVWLVPLLIWFTTVVVTSGTPRLRAGLDPFIVLLAGYTVSWAISFWRRRREGDAGEAAGAGQEPRAEAKALAMGPTPAT
jgi:4-amino-4-deoxy-L-arabinose transferase-like glycosyltransferase